MQAAWLDIKGRACAREPARGRRSSVSPGWQIFATPSRAFWRQQLQAFLDQGCKYEIEALNAVHHVGSDPLGYDLFPAVNSDAVKAENDKDLVVTTGVLLASAGSCLALLFTTRFAGATTGRMI